MLNPTAQPFTPKDIKSCKKTSSQEGFPQPIIIKDVAKKWIKAHTKTKPSKHNTTSDKLTFRNINWHRILEEMEDQEEKESTKDYHQNRRIKQKLKL